MPKNKWIFYSKSAKHMIDASSIEPEQRYQTGGLKKMAYIIAFDNHFHITDKKIYADLIKSLPDYAIGKIREVDEEQMMQLLGEQAARLGLSSNVLAEQINRTSHPEPVNLGYQEVAEPEPIENAV